MCACESSLQVQGWGRRMKDPISLLPSQPTQVYVQEVHWETLFCVREMVLQLRVPTVRTPLQTILRYSYVHSRVCVEGEELRETNVHLECELLSQKTKVKTS